MKKTTLLYPFSLLCVLALSSGSGRFSISGIYPGTEMPDGTTIATPLPRPGKDRALFFAVEKYQHSKLTNLQNPVKNARDLADVLKTRFGFEAEVLENPTQKQIIDKLNELTRLYARNEDGKHPSDGQLFLFFSGHGLSEDENGYFLPADADPAAPWDKGIAYEIWRPKINKINCRHVLVALDACYSVRFDPDWKNKTDGQFKRPGELTDSQRALANYETYKARVFYTSDNKEDQTPDRSNFAKKLLEGLRSANATDGFLTSKQLFANYVEGATPTPRAGTFGDDEPSSAFLFYDLNGPAKPAPQPAAVNTEADDRAFEKAKSRNTVESYQDYLDVFPNGRHKATSEAAMAALKNKKETVGPTSTQEKPKSDPIRPSTTALPDDGLVFVKGGTFTMGCTSEQKDCGNDEKPTHTVTLDDFYIGKYEVTQKLWQQVMGNNPSTASKECPECPVETVSWNEVQDFLKKLNAQNPGRQYRLPTEAEWEYAARGGSPSEGYLYAGSNDIGMVAWHTNNSGKKTQPVGKRKGNELGLYDMSGNVNEWCSDWYGTYTSDSQTNPAGPASGTSRVIRGGSWDFYPQYCRVAIRYYDAPGVRSSVLGFRLARTN